MMKKLFAIALMVAFATMISSQVHAHCQVPCGIFDDSNRFEEMNEDVKTIAKAMKQIEELSAAEKPNMNQIVRWVKTKEEHASKLMNTVATYFLAQRLKVVSPENKEAYAAYLKELQTLHHITFHAMKTKHGTDLKHTEKLTALIHDYQHMYQDRTMKKAKKK